MARTAMTKSRRKSSCKEGLETRLLTFVTCWEKKALGDRRCVPNSMLRMEAGVKAPTMAALREDVNLDEDWYDWMRHLLVV